MINTGILHPGEMGISIAASAIHDGHRIYRVSQNRSNRTHARAPEHGLIEFDAMHQLCRTCEVLISVCPPHAAEGWPARWWKQDLMAAFKEARETPHLDHVLSALLT